MALFNLQGRWLQGNLEINIVMNTADEFNIKALSAELQKYWQAGYGTVHQSGKFEVTLSNRTADGHVQDGHIQGYVTADGKSMHFNNGVIWILQHH
jgi:hypothetical protein